MVVGPFEDGKHGTCESKGRAAKIGKADRRPSGGEKQHLGYGETADCEVVSEPVRRPAN
jgi:hypothetical protein